jgi:hypothetical protein
MIKYSEKGKKKKKKEEEDRDVSKPPIPKVSPK